MTLEIRRPWIGCAVWLSRASLRCLPSFHEHVSVGVYSGPVTTLVSNFHVGRKLWRGALVGTGYVVGIWKTSTATHTVRRGP